MRGRDYRKKCKNPQYRSGNREGRRFAKHMNTESEKLRDHGK